ncbi:hypothetical protein C9J01_17215 [Photobacterium rosenbergii]|uniref:Polysaccharide biosynthesis protein C-terminal domain-containing protein n=1 Tax=Photobacterium rosenbergii TaxID=294936 RepID=A0A2T3NBI5_9GAMM|nr:oligosaccharide flippase family protein [Photobacterium rosenbergii]PSW11195.1 hypothetical protein C9J01_17215 [Photobacterium rosenbergii]
MLKRILKNFFSLVGVQVVSAIFGIVTVPLLISKIGISEFGTFSVLLSIATIINICVDFGLNISGVRRLLILKKEEVKSFIVSVIIIRCVIFSCLASIFILYIGLSSGNYEYLYILLFSASSIFQINYFLKAFEKMWIITIITFLQRCFSFLLIYNSIDPALHDAIIYYCVPFFIMPLLSFMLLLFHFRDSKVTLDIVNIKSIFIDSFNMFIGVFGSTLYRNLSIPIFSLFLSSDIIGYYSAVEKVLKGIQGIVNSGAEALYPVLCRTKELSKFYNKISVFIGGTSFLVMATVGVGIYNFDYLFGLKLNEYSELIIFSLACAFSIGSMCFLIGVMYFFSKGKQKTFSLVTIKSGISSIVLALISGSLGFVKFMLVVPLIAELLILIMLMKARGINEK